MIAALSVFLLLPLCTTSQAILDRSLAVRDDEAAWSRVTVQVVNATDQELGLLKEWGYHALGSVALHPGQVVSLVLRRLAPGEQGADFAALRSGDHAYVAVDVAGTTEFSARVERVRPGVADESGGGGIVVVEIAY